jgi:hypothetical protein
MMPFTDGGHTALQPPGDTPDRIASVAFWTLLVLITAALGLVGPVLTSDGPAHVAMAHFLTLAGNPEWAMLNRLFEINPTLSPNALGHFLLAGLMWVFPPLVAEQIVQAVCVISIPLAARLTLRRLAPDAGWIALFFFPVALQRMFYMGLYNYCLSLTGCILCIWAFLRFREKSSAINAIILAAILLVTLACQASGWMEAVVAVGTMALVDAGCGLFRGEPIRPVLGRATIVLLALVPGLLLFAQFALGGAGPHEIGYGPSPLARLYSVVVGDSFAPIGRSTAWVGLLLGVTLALLAVSGSVALRQTSSRQPDRTYSDRDLRLAICMLPVAFLAFLTILPDRAGGGWTHTWRAEPLPYVGLALACAMLPAPRMLQRAAMAAATVGSLVAFGMMVWVQAWQVPSAVREFNEADALIGAHCTVAPVLGQFKLDPLNTARLFYHPLFHIANRFGLKYDRAVLFSYGARLPIYPVRFRPQANPHRFLYGWEPGQSDTHVYQIDPIGFEAATGVPVDYILLWDMPAPNEAGLFSAIRPSVIRAGYQLAYRSSGKRMELYRRPGPGGCVKP